MKGCKLHSPFTHKSDEARCNHCCDCKCHLDGRIACERCCKYWVNVPNIVEK
jgi:hypothetical protein